MDSSYHCSDSPSSSSPIPISFSDTIVSNAATKIQSLYRSHLTRTLVRRILYVDSRATTYEAMIQTQETVDAVRRDEKERVRVSEGLMAILLKLDSVPGFYPTVRDLRRSVSRRIVGLQELLDAVVAETVVGLEGFPTTWEDFVYGTTEERAEEKEEEEEEEDDVLRRCGNWRFFLESW